MQRVLVTGSAGFTGSTLLRLWSEIGPQAVCVGIDRVQRTGLPAQHARVCNLHDFAAILALVQEVRPTLVFHLAGTFTNDFDADLAGNVQCTRNLLEAVRQGADPTCHTLVVGSSAEYGRVDPGIDAISEAAALRPISAYGLTKVLQTNLAAFYARAHGLHVMNVRPFNLIGPGMSPRLFTGNLYSQLIAFRQGKAVEIRLGSLSGERDFIDVRDALRAYIAVVQRGVPGESYNVGSGRLTAIAMLVRDIMTHCGIDPRSLQCDDATGQPSDAARPVPADITKLRQLGWAPEVSYDAFIRAFCAPVGNASPVA